MFSPRPIVALLQLSLTTCRAVKRLCLLAACGGLSACAHRPRQAGDPTANSPGAAAPGTTAQVSRGNTAAAERLGTVEVIGTGQRFVLVRTPSWQSGSTLVDGQALVCRAGGNITATLQVSRERRPPFVVADVVNGEPHVGDEVLIDTAPAHTTVPGPSAAPGATPAPEFHANPVLPATP